MCYVYAANASDGRLSFADHSRTESALLKCYLNWTGHGRGESARETRFADSPKMARKRKEKKVKDNEP